MFAMLGVNKNVFALFFQARGDIFSGSYYTRTSHFAMPIPITLDAAAAARAGGDDDACLQCSA